EMLCGRLVLEIEADMMAAQGADAPLGPEEWNVEVPREIGQVVSKARAADPAARYQTASEFDRALAAAAESIERAPEPVGVDVPALPPADDTLVEAVAAEAATPVEPAPVEDVPVSPADDTAVEIVAAETTVEDVPAILPAEDTVVEAIAVEAAAPVEPALVE